MRNDINWLDGKDAKGKFILEINFQNGGTGFLKNNDVEKLNHYVEVLFSSPEVMCMTIYNPEGVVVSSKPKYRAAA